MNEPLHPLSLSEILDRTAQLYRSRFLIFLGIAAIPAATVFVLAAAAFAFIAWMGSNARHGAAVSDSVVWMFLILLAILIVPVSLGASAVGQAAMSDAAASVFLGKKITIRGSYSATWKRGWRYVGLYALQGLVIVGAPLVLFCLALMAMILGKVKGYEANDPSALFGGLLFVLLFALTAFAVWMLLRLCLAFPASVVEQTSAWNALKRGVLLSRGTKGRILVLYVLGVILNQVLAIGFTVPALVAMAFIPGLQGQAHAQTAGIVAMFVVYGSYFAVRALIKPVYGIGLTIFYFDQRIRKEGFDIEWMMQQAGMAPTSAQPAPALVAGDSAETLPAVSTLAAAMPSSAQFSPPVLMHQASDVKQTTGNGNG